MTDDFFTVLLMLHDTVRRQATERRVMLLTYGNCQHFYATVTDIHSLNVHVYDIILSTQYVITANAHLFDVP